MDRYDDNPFDYTPYPEDDYPAEPALIRDQFDWGGVFATLALCGLCFLLGFIVGDAR